MSTILVVGPDNPFLQKLVEAFIAEGLEVFFLQEKLKEADYIFYSTLDESDKAFSERISNLRETARENHTRLVILLLDTKKNNKLLNKLSGVDERHVYISNNNPVLEEESWEKIKRLGFSPLFKNSSILIEANREFEKDEPHFIFQPKTTAPISGSVKKKSGSLFIVPVLLTVIVFFILSPFVGIELGKALFKLEGIRIYGVAQVLIKTAHSGFSFYSKTPYIGKYFENYKSRAAYLSILVGVAAEHKTAIAEAKSMFVDYLSKNTVTFERLGTSRNRLEKLTRDFDFLKSETVDYSSEFSFEDMSNSSKVVLGMVNYLTQIITREEPDNYLLLFTDASQLRGSGGVVLGYGVLKLGEKGIEDFDTFLPVEIDSKLRGEVAPPGLLKLQLNKNLWYFKDSSWSPNFESSAARASWFFEKATGERITNVISVDTEFIRNFDTAEETTSEDFYKMMQKKGEKFVLEKIQESYELLLSNPEIGVERLTKIVFDSFQTKHLLFKASSNGQANVLGEKGGEGSFRGGSCINTEICIDDYLQIVTTTLGGSNLSFKDKKEYKLEAKIQTGKVMHKLILNREKNILATKEYLRVYVPVGAIMSEPIAVNFETGKQEKLKVDKARESGKSVFGFVLEIPKGEQREVFINWTTLGHTSTYFDQYNLVWQKQAGTVGADVSVEVQHGVIEKPAYFLIPKGRALTRKGSFVYNAALTQDLDLRLLWK